jgi:hypothetical protein
MLLFQHAHDTPRRATPGALSGREAGEVAVGQRAAGSTYYQQRVWTRPTWPGDVLPQTKLDGDRHDQADDDTNDRDRS